MSVIGWMAGFLVFLGLELAQRALTSLWFSGGAAAAAVAARLGVSVPGQLGIFVISSTFILFLIRPLTLAAGQEKARKGEQDAVAAGSE